jgi:Arc/MetJ-type ribon-helix-helix transcriptional regulator
MAKRRKDLSDVPYGLTAVTLGEVLKEQLDEAVAATNGNRSQIIREALERYLDQLPQLEKQRKEREQAIRDRALPIALYRAVEAFRTILGSFDYDGLFPETLYKGVSDSIDELRDWLQTNIPDERPLRLEEAALEGALSDLERSSHRLERSTHGDEWESVVNRWCEVQKERKVYQ